MIVIDTIKYFAKFPAKEWVLKAFASGKSPVSGYAQLKAEITAMTEHSLIPEIEGFIIGADIEDVKKSIDNQSGVFMFFDYGELSSSRTQQNSIENRWSCSITIANKMNAECDTLEFGINSDNMLSLAQRLLAKMNTDQEHCSWLRTLSQNYTLIPFDVKQLSAYGWSILFEREGADMLNIKNLPK